MEISVQGKRTCFHPGIGSGAGNAPSDFGKHVNSREILRHMLSFVWPKEQPWIRRRVVLALSLLVGAKVS